MHIECNGSDQWMISFSTRLMIAILQLWWSTKVKTHFVKFLLFLSLLIFFEFLKPNPKVFKIPKHPHPKSNTHPSLSPSAATTCYSPSVCSGCSFHDAITSDRGLATLMSGLQVTRWGRGRASGERVMGKV